MYVTDWRAGYRQLEGLLAGLEHRTNTQLHGLEQRTNTQLHGLEQRTNKQFQALEDRTSIRSKEIEDSTSLGLGKCINRLEGLEDRLNKRLDHLDRRCRTQARMLYGLVGFTVLSVRRMWRRRCQGFTVLCQHGPVSGAVHAEADQLTKEVQLSVADGHVEALQLAEADGVPVADQTDAVDEECVTDAADVIDAVDEEYVTVQDMQEATLLLGAHHTP